MNKDILWFEVFRRKNLWFMTPSAKSGIFHELMLPANGKNAFFLTYRTLI
jgi:hypothetical protein